MGFAGFLRQSTAVDVLIGPFVDSTNGNDEETGLTIEDSDIRLSANGQTAAAKNDVTDAAHDADGFYNCELDATDTATVGTLAIYVHVAGALAVRHDFQVVEEATYDFLFASGAAPIADINAEVDTGITDAALATAANLETVDTNVDAILIDTASTIPSQITGLNDISAANVNTEVVDVMRTDLIPNAVNTDGTMPTIAQAIYLILQALTEHSVSGTTDTIKAVDGSTTLATVTLSDATNPTSVTRAT